MYDISQSSTSKPSTSKSNSSKTRIAKASQFGPVAATVAIMSVFGAGISTSLAADFADQGYRSDNTVRPYSDQRYDRLGPDHDDAYEDALRRFDEGDRISRNHRSYDDDNDYVDRYHDDDDQSDGDTYAAPNGAPEPYYRGSLKDDPYTVPQYREHTRRHYDVRPAPRRYGYARCLPRRQVKRSLWHQGWRHFRLAEVRGDIAHVFASRAQAPGRFKLAVDRCSGDIVSVVRAPRRHWRPAHSTWRRSVLNRFW